MASEELVKITVITAQIPKKEAELLRVAAKGCGTDIGDIIGYMVQHFREELKKMASKPE